MSQLIERISFSGRWVTLVKVTTDATRFLYELSTDEAIGPRWRFTGAVPSFEQFQQTLWQGVLSQFVVLENEGKQPIGHVVAYNADLHHGFTYIGESVLEEVSGSGAGIEALLVFIRYVFATYNLRKLYFEVPEYNLSAFSSTVDWLLRREGRLKEHTFYQGRFWDRHILALYRPDFEDAWSNYSVTGKLRSVRRSEFRSG